MPIDPHTERNEIGRNLGHDLYRFGRHAGLDRLSPAVEEGYVQARARQVACSAPDRFVRKWLQLRVNAYRRDRVVDAGVTPALLASIDVTECPVLRVPLTHGLGAPSDWSVDRLNNDGGYARSNLAVMSTLANRAKGARSFDDVLERSQPRTDTNADADGLTPTQWLRMAVLMLGPSFATDPRCAPLLPLVAPIPNYTVRSASQIVQNLFTLQARRLSGKNALLRQLKPACCDARSLMMLERFADAIHQGLKVAEPCWDVWQQPRVMTAFCEWRHAIAPRQWALVGSVASRLTSAQPVPSQRLDAWHLGSHGYH